MSMDTSSKQNPSTTAILGGAVDAIQESPRIVGVFLVAGVLGAVVPSILNSTVVIVATSIGVVIAYRALDGQVRANSSFLFRLFKAWVALFIVVLPLLVGIFALFLTVPSSSVLLLGLFVLLLPWLYLLTRLLLSVPAVMIDDYGPFEALSESWRLTSESARTIGAALVVIILIGALFGIPLVMLTRSDLAQSIAGALFVDMFLAGIQAFLYSKLAEAS